MIEAWKKLSQGQRVAAVLVAIALLASLAPFVLGASGTTYQHLLQVDTVDYGDELASFTAALDRIDADWDLRTSDDGLVAVLVAAGEDYQKSILLAAEAGLPFKSEPPESTGGASNWFPSLSDERERLDAARKRDVEMAIRWYPSVDSVRVVIQRSKSRSHLRNRREPESAAVAVKLEPQVLRLPRNEAQTIRKLVHAAFNIPQENIQVIDNHLFDYSAEPVLAGGVAEVDELFTAEIEGTVRALLQGSFASEEVCVAVVLPPPELSSAGTASKGTGTASGRRQQLESSPALRVHVGLELASVKHILEERQRLLSTRAISTADASANSTGLLARLSEWEREKERFLASQLAVASAGNVTVRAQPLATRIAGASRTPGPAGAAWPSKGGLFESEKSTRRAGGFWTLWSLAARFPDVVVLPALALLATLCLVFALRIGRPRVRVQQRAAGEPVRVSAENVTICADLLRWTREAELDVRMRPEIAARVLRDWMVSDPRTPTIALQATAVANGQSAGRDDAMRSEEDSEPSFVGRRTERREVDDRDEVLQQGGALKQSQDKDAEDDLELVTPDAPREEQPVAAAFVTPNLLN